MKYLLPFLLLFFSRPSVMAEHQRQQINNPVAGNSIEIDTVATEMDAELCFNFLLPRNRHSDYNCSLTVTLAGTSRISSLNIIETVSNPNDLYEKRTLKIVADSTTLKSFTNDVDLFGGDNYLVINLKDEDANIFIGNDRLNYCGTVHVGKITSIKLEELNNANVSCLTARAETPYPVLNRVDTTALQSVVEPSSPLSPEGIWQFLDRDNDPDYARPGGQYQLAVIPSPTTTGDYFIVYLSGAEVNDRAWQPGMVKGILSPTSFQGRYKLKWWDAMMNPVDGECHAIHEASTLTLAFPLLNASLRFSR